jgi:hypothetical protein
MASEMTYLTDEILRQAVEKQEDEFDSHDLFATLMREQPNDYAHELNECTDQRDCFEKLHPRIARILASERFHDCVKQIHKKRRSMNCRGQETECEIWERVKA